MHHVLKRPGVDELAGHKVRFSSPDMSSGASGTVTAVVPALGGLGSALRWRGRRAEGNT